MREICAFVASVIHWQLDKEKPEQASVHFANPAHPVNPVNSVWISVGVKGEGDDSEILMIIICDRISRDRSKAGPYA